jgi:drug/metabolite transporter (DMT)-like permease
MLALISGAWGSSFLFVKLISGSLAPFTFAAGRGFIAMAALLVWLTLRRGALGDAPDGVTPSLAEFRHMAVLGTTNGWFANVMMVVAVKYAPSSTVALVQTAVPLMVAALAHFLFPRERLSPVQWLGVFAGLAGVALIVGRVLAIAEPDIMVGVAAMLVTAFSFACGTIYARHAAIERPALVACGQQAFGAVVATAAAFGTETSDVMAQPPLIWLLLAVIGIVCSAVPTALYLQLLARTSTVPAALVAYLQPVWATLVGWAVLGERIGPRALIGIALVFAGVFVTGRAVRRRGVSG